MVIRTFAGQALGNPVDEPPKYHERVDRANRLPKHSMGLEHRNNYDYCYI